MKNELLEILNQRRVLAILICLPIIYTLIFGALFSRNSLTGVPIIVVNLDDGTKGQTLLRDLMYTPELEVVEVEGDAADIEAEILRREVVGAVVIPQDYSQKISRGTSVNVEVIIDNTNTVAGGTVTRAAQSVITAQSATALVNARIAAGWDTYQAQTAALSVSTRNFYNPTNGYSDFFLTVLMIHSLQIAVVFTLAPNFVTEKFARNITPEIFVEKVFLYTLIEVAVGAVCCTIGIKIFGIVCRGDFVEILALMTAFIFAIVSFALTVGAWVNTDFHTISYTLAYIMPSILFTGAIFPRYTMDKFSLMLSYLVPIGYAANDIRNFFVKGTSYGWELHALILILFGGIFFAAGVGRIVSVNAARTSTAD